MPKEEEFRITANEKIVALMMHMKTRGKMFNYADLGDSQILELPYKSGEISMLILLPADDIESMEKILTNKKLAEYKTEMGKTELDAIAMPKFEFDAKYFMKEALVSMGIKTAFADNADFSGMSKGDLFISDVIHQAYIKVDEAGTEAAAATATGVSEWALPLRKTVFKADHPFIFIIEEKATGDILFMGKVTDPRG
ncbi:MAG: serpin family protein [bacterium]